MGHFFTNKSRLEQTNIAGVWFTLDNQLYYDDDGVIYLAPRHTLTDGYTIPEFATSIVGGKMYHDVRCAVQHDWECYYHKAIIVNLSRDELYERGYLRVHKGMTVCEDLPLELLTIKDTTFKETNDRFMRMLKSLFYINKFKGWLIGKAVNLNIGWLKKPHEFHPERLYRIDYEQIR